MYTTMKLSIVSDWDIRDNGSNMITAKVFCQISGVLTHSSAGNTRWPFPKHVAIDLLVDSL